MTSRGKEDEGGGRCLEKEKEAMAATEGDPCTQEVRVAIPRDPWERRESCHNTNNPLSASGSKLYARRLGKRRRYAS